jgi:hypothetical protein
LLAESRRATAPETVHAATGRDIDRSWLADVSISGLRVSVALFC